MKMRLTAFLVFTLLSISVLSYGVNGSIFADSHDLLPVNTSSNMNIVANGANVVISGSLKDYDPLSPSAGAVTYVVKSPENNLVTIGQLVPDSDGTFEFSFIAGGQLWKLSGDYVVETKYGGNTSELVLDYVGGELVVSTVTCTSNQQLINGVCIDKKSEPPVTCTSNQQLVNGQCIDNEPPPPPPPVTCTSNQQLVNGQCIDNEPEQIVCGPGTEPDANGICQIIPTKPDDKEPPGGSCLIATAAYGTELAPQIQLLREVRDNTVLSTASGSTFMAGFNTLYYSFAPTVADWERENPIFKESVKVFITPMVSTLSIMTLADTGSEVEVLGLGISVIALNLGMYIAAPALVGFKVHKHLKSRK
ncbi:CFI-box-CTERM domain-containing protein [Nitrosopumilus ureiphilus]|uniref:Copper-binding protein n=1 Tax=Nitrosopumilus ureiphilus TaxID=1470067 RepID=A0A7D5M3X7_9ARCH|nr:CFI-box-CTERM domain-containing protein [Nitrosopumilus ureiphilus]QLH06053.1 hypothetical protein C5F50_02385 [Nitrosopumilus ureiphilus]